MDVSQYLLTKDLRDIFGSEWNPEGTQKWYQEMLDFELESYKRRTTEDLEELKGTLENAVRDHRWRDLEYGTLDPVDVINWHACRKELARRGSPVLTPRPAKHFLVALASCRTPDASARQSAEDQAHAPADRLISNWLRTRGCR